MRQSLITRPTNAHYAIMCSVDSVDLKSAYIAPAKDKEGKQISEPSCKYSAHVRGTIQIYSITERRVIESINLTHTDLDFKDTKSTSCRMDSGIYALARSATTGAVSEVRAEFQNFFSPKGYILAKKANEDKRIFKISLGRHHNLKRGQYVEIYAKKSFTNELTNEISADEVKIADGKVTDYIHSTFSWISVPDTGKADQIKLGDYVKISYKKSLLEGIGNITDALKTFAK